MKNKPTKRHQKSEAIKELEELAFKNLQQKFPKTPYLIRPAFTDATSNGLTKAVVAYINLLGFHAERINSTGGIRDTRKTVKDVLGNSRTIGSVQWIKSTTQSGTADISATIAGKSVKIEIKCKATCDRYQSEAQKAYQKQIEDAGGIYIIIRTFEEFYNWFNSKNQSHE